MAEGKANDKEVQETCSVCLEPFTEPKVLPCCHTFCLRCLETTAATASGAEGGAPKNPAEIKCPQCRKTHAIPADGMEGFLTDFVAARDAEEARRKAPIGTRPRLDGNPPTPVCGECESKEAVESFCTNCRAYLCSEYSSQAHKKYKSYHGHRVIPISDLDAATLQSSKVHYCSAHKGEDLRLFCKTCRKLICRDCAVSDHRQHRYTFLQDVRKKISNRMSTLMEEGKKKLAMFENNFVEIKNAETSAVAYPEALKADVNAFCDELIQSIETRRQMLLTEADVECQKDLKQIWADKTFHETTIPQINAALRLGKKANRCTSDVEMILTALPTIDQLVQLETVEWESSAFTTIVASPAIIDEGQKLPVNEASCIVRSTTIGGMVIAAPVPTSCVVGQRITFSVIPQELVDGRRKKTIRLQQNDNRVKNLKVTITRKRTDYSAIFGGYNRTMYDQCSQFYSVSKSPNGSYEVTLSPTNPATFSISVTYDGQSVKGSPFIFHCKSASKKSSQSSATGYNIISKKISQSSAAGYNIISNSKTSV